MPATWKNRRAPSEAPALRSTSGEPEHPRTGGAATDDAWPTGVTRNKQKRKKETVPSLKRKKPRGKTGEKTNEQPGTRKFYRYLQGEISGISRTTLRVLQSRRFSFFRKQISSSFFPFVLFASSRFRWADLIRMNPASWVAETCLSVARPLGISPF